ncbi:UDP-N-acetylmuramate dehydrogenase [Grimontia hollisae]|uniref:UDP-N-acetylenolpyruvoylglucosamine reductase n=3 Tax=Grimontia hollisae TaxID=673 RepID=D0I3L1_GRIHO|nr:UDP-N-acetylmuramate dehydrogenase [Grimontia hollisae]EEY74032.1 UDP-N-acetylenolpyruvoylglucosamine reductase [Grimontia hollisae CIP 101886]AMG30743.1 UDP-N-acetylmuramate dehydrogenase [Grimontia hollisae]STO47500.1 UDP-N-acetylenolpyruvoylglucosamine reductase [Grimontia hollisae]STO56228.1 UDP-N-acetylenolpyruvoylglucosamine reductase [Grimontia hollisae]STQ77271.1 UDP-N-acetylenolpyruvoylglucosamine reductase [Grimontia hollisae]
MKTLSNTSLKSFHTFGIDINAKIIVEAQTADDLIRIWHDYANEAKLIVGEGSNLLFCENFDGVVVLNRLKGVEVEETEFDWHLHVAGGENWHQLVRWTIENGMPGLENLALIPGLVGSAPIQNIGAYGVELNERCEYVDVLMLESGEIVRMGAGDCEFGYRDSVFKRELKDKAIIVAVGLKLSKIWVPVIGYGALNDLSHKADLSAKEVFDKVCEIRREKLPDPEILGNAGSFFKNPVVPREQVKALLEQYEKMPSFDVSEREVKLAAGWLIDQCGLKGYCIGDAAVHNKQALVLINKGNATADNVIALAKHVVDTVYARFGVLLEHEVRFMGATAETTLEAICQH